jgi:hypothetical protein
MHRPPSRVLRNTGKKVARRITAILEPLPDAEPQDQQGKSHRQGRDVTTETPGWGRPGDPGGGAQSLRAPPEAGPPGERPNPAAMRPALAPHVRASSPDAAREPREEKTCSGEGSR